MLNMYTAIVWLIGDNDILIYLLIMYSKTLNLFLKTVVFWNFQISLEKIFHHVTPGERE